MNLRGHLILLADKFDYYVLGHRVGFVCHLLPRSSWWNYVPEGHPWNDFMWAKWEERQ